MSDLIRREDALRVTLAYASSYSAEQAETAINALPAVQPDAAAIREAALEDAIDHARQALVDAAYAYGDLQCKKSSAMFMAETHVYIAIRALINKPAAHHVNETPKSEHDAANVLTPATGDA